MKCAWEAYVNLLPPKLRRDVDRLGAQSAQELRLRSGKNPILKTAAGETVLPAIVTGEDLQYVIGMASKFSPWASESTASGYLTAEGGHRIGICGEAILRNGVMTGFRSVTSVCMRVARDFPGIAAAAASISGSVLIIGKPGSGKTTLLRDLIRVRAGQGSVTVVDERGELFPMRAGRHCFDVGCATDVLTGCGKKHGIELALRTMDPACIAVDEISAEEDCRAILRAGWCGVPILATAHAADLCELRRRPLYRPIVDKSLFQTVIVINPDKTWKAEEMVRCT